MKPIVKRVTELTSVSRNMCKLQSARYRRFRSKGPQRKGCGCSKKGTLDCRLSNELHCGQPETEPRPCRPQRAFVKDGVYFSNRLAGPVRWQVAAQAMAFLGGAPSIQEGGLSGGGGERLERTGTKAQQWMSSNSGNISCR